jgi:hypothetical protein
MLQGELRVKAIRTLEALLDAGPAATRFNAAKLVLEWGDEAGDGDEKGLGQMSLAELEELVRRKEADLKRVAPGNGAHQL